MRQLGDAYVTSLGSQRAGHERSGVADQHAVYGIADLSRYQHLATLDAGAGGLNLAYG